MLSVCTSSTEVELAALGDLMVLLGTTASSSGMSLAIQQSSDWCERYITNSQGGSIRRSVVRETVAGSGSQQLMLSRTPVLKVGRIFSSTTTADATEYCSTDFRLDDPDAGFVSLTNDAGFAWDAIWRQGLTRYPQPSAVTKNWLVEYEAGWQFACTSSTGTDWLTTTTGKTIPGEVERAVLLKAAEFYQGSSRGIESMRVGPLHVNYGSESLDPVAELLSLYRRVF